MSGFTAAYREAAKRGTSVISGFETGLQIDHKKIFESFEDPTMPYRMKMMKDICGRLACVNNPKCLDVGCAVGIDLGLLRDAFGTTSHQIVGVDLLGAQLGVAREKLPQALFVQGDVAALPFENDEFDSVQCSRLLIHVENVFDAVHEMLRVLKPGGLLSLSEGDLRTSMTLSSDPVVTKLAQEKNLHSIRMSKNPYIASSLYRSLVNDTRVEKLQIATHSVVSVDPLQTLPWDKGIFEKLVENGKISALEKDYYLKNVEDIAKGGDLISLSSIFLLQMVKK